MQELPHLLRAVIANLSVQPKQEQTAIDSTQDIDDFREASSAPNQQESIPSGLTILEPLFFSHELNPVNEKAQSLVAVPEGLDLESWIVPQSILPISQPKSLDADVDEYGRPKGGFNLQANGSLLASIKKGKSKKDRSETGEKKKKKKKKGTADAQDSDDIDSIPIVKIDLGPSKFGFRLSICRLAVIQSGRQHLVQRLEHLNL